MVPHFLSLLLLLVISCSGLPVESAAEDTYADRRARMVEEQLEGRDIRDPGVLEVMGQVPRHRFVPEEIRPLAYQDSPLPIAEGQTISQPYIVALMTQLAEPQAGDRALEIGTGSGYQAAVLASLVSEVYTIEIVPDLAQQAAHLLQELGYSNVHSRQGDGYSGWPEAGPFDLILITAAAPRIPEPLLEQLAEGGRLVLPVGPPGGYQELILIEKKEDRTRKRTIIPVRFVPMTGKAQQPE